MKLLVAILILIPHLLTSQILVFDEALFDNQNGIDGLDGVMAIVVSDDGKFMYTTSEGDDALCVFSLDAAGDLSLVEVHQDVGQGGLVNGLNNPRRLAISPDNHHLYVPCSLGDALVVFSRDDVNGTLTYVETITEGAGGGGDDLDGLYHAKVSPDNDYVYTVSSSDDALSVFSRNTITGQLTFIESHKDNLNGVDGLEESRAIDISPDGKHVYAASTEDDAIAVFSRDLANGQLTFFTTYYDGIGGIDGLDGARGIIIDASGQYVYVSAEYDDSITVFSRDDNTGALSFLETHKDNSQGGAIPNLDRATYADISNTGRYLIVSSRDNNSISLFSRNLNTGLLTFQEDFVDGVNGVDGLEGTRMTKFGNTDERIYSVGYGDNAIATFTNLIPLSVELLDIKAQFINDCVKLSWTIKNDTPVTNMFSIQRSYDHKKWAPIGESKGQSGNQITHYHYSDYQYSEGSNYYRIKYTNTENQIYYSNVVAVNIVQNNDLLIYPNPTNHLAHLQFNKNFKNINMVILNDQGQIIMCLPDYYPKEQIDLSALSPGTYILLYQCEKKTGYKKIVKL